MSYEAWGDGDEFHGPDGYVSDERAEEVFVEGAQAMREFIARSCEQNGSPPAIAFAGLVRTLWLPAWGDDPGTPDKVQEGAWS